MKNLLAKTAFLQKNFRVMSFEMKIIFISHLLTAVFCFMPWISYSPLYGSSYFENAFGGTIKLMGFMIFLISLMVSAFFIADKILKLKTPKLPLEENVIFIFAGIQQIILIICAWSVLFFMGSGYDLLETRFGIVFCLFFQIFALVGAFLLKKGNQKEEVINFFHQAEEKIIDNTKNLFDKGKKEKPSDSMKSREK